MAEFNSRTGELEFRITELYMKNAALEERNVEFKKGYEAQQDSNDHGRKELEDKIATIKSKCISMESLRENEKFVKFCTGLPDYDILKAA